MSINWLVSLAMPQKSRKTMIKNTLLTLAHNAVILTSTVKTTIKSKTFDNIESALGFIKEHNATYKPLNGIVFNVITVEEDMTQIIKAGRETGIFVKNVKGTRNAKQVFLINGTKSLRKQEIEDKKEQIIELVAEGDMILASKLFEELNQEQEPVREIEEGVYKVTCQACNLEMVNVNPDNWECAYCTTQYVLGIPYQEEFSSSSTYYQNFQEVCKLLEKRKLIKFTDGTKLQKKEGDWWLIEKNSESCLTFKEAKSHLFNNLNKLKK